MTPPNVNYLSFFEIGKKIREELFVDCCVIDFLWWYHLFMNTSVDEVFVYFCFFLEKNIIKQQTLVKQLTLPPLAKQSLRGVSALDAIALAWLQRRPHKTDYKIMTQEQMASGAQRNGIDRIENASLTKTLPMQLRNIVFDFDIHPYSQ